MRLVTAVLHATAAVAFLQCIHTT